MYPLFVYGPFMEGEPFSWITRQGGTSPARVRGTLWRLPCGEVVLQCHDDGGWIDGELIDRPTPDQVRLVETVLGSAERNLFLARTHARVELRALAVEVFAADASALRRLSATPLKTRDPRRILRPFPPTGSSRSAPDDRAGRPRRTKRAPAD